MELAHLCGIFRCGAVSFPGLPQSGNRRRREASGRAMVRLLPPFLIGIGNIGA